MIFLDYLTMSQNRPPKTLPVVGEHFRISTSLETGELVSESVTSLPLSGSWDTSLRLRCDGSSVNASGNPSAYDRMDNLFGHTSVQSAVQVVNLELLRHGLPAFDSVAPEFIPVRVRFLPAQCRSGVLGSFVSTPGPWAAHAQSLLSDDRARISRIDLTQNLTTSDARAFIRQLSGYQHHGKPGRLFPNGASVDWGGSRRVYVKFYDKAADIENKIKTLRKSLNSKHRETIQSHIDYLEILKKWCLDHGIVRHEISIKSTELIDRKLIHPDTWSNETMTNVIRPYQFQKKIRLEETRFDSIADTLLAQGDISPRVARQAELIHSAWIQGKDIREVCGSKATFYRYRSILLGIGIDIFNPCDISRITLRASTCEWKEAQPPEWYNLPNLKLVA